MSNATAMPSASYLGLVVLILAASIWSGTAGGPWVYSDNAPVPKDTIRITTLGSGTPDVRKEQASSGFLVELGNGDKLIFDFGTGAYTNLLATGVPAAELTKVFLTHLHSDHIADLATFYVNAMFGRREAWEVWGPSAKDPAHGTAAVIDGLRKFLAWDTHSRRKIDLVGRIDKGDKVIAHEFDYSVENQVIYEQNGVKITSTPVNHYNTSGPVALRLDWNGLSFTYSGDTTPIPTLNDLARGSDLLILQNMGPIKDFAALSYESQLLLNTSHITPKQAGKILSDLKPRLAVIHHLTLNDLSRVPVVTDIRENYPVGDIHVNEDLDVFEITKDQIYLKKRLVPYRSWGYWHAELNWNSQGNTAAQQFRSVA
ncbi:hypothetical protein WJX72_012114 [[Myrmecia] bisecta]|uniref:Metallo-beta-lactamase domain-containing protein n=1 Tax=[Myrmecia] bisecta TaxID=41462 RepID=A0AAW1PQH3_9CHLO